MTFAGNVPVIIFGDHTRCIKYIDFPFAQGADGVKVLKPKQFFIIKAFYYAFQTVDIPNMGYRRHFPLFEKYAIPVPPLPEQQRIVDRIESLFSKPPSSTKPLPANSPPSGEKNTMSEWRVGQKNVLMK